jgi:hypothetical protein
MTEESNLIDLASLTRTIVIQKGEIANGFMGSCHQCDQCFNPIFHKEHGKKRLFAGLCILLAVFTLGFKLAPEEKKKQLECQRLVIVDKNGIERGVIGVDDKDLMGLVIECFSREAEQMVSHLA